MGCFYAIAFFGKQLLAASSWLLAEDERERFLPGAGKPEGNGQELEACQAAFFMMRSRMCLRDALLDGVAKPGRGPGWRWRPGGRAE